MNGDPQPAKRQKIDVACENCRTRKVRCDGGRPACSSCVRRHETCTFVASLLPWDRTRQQYVEDLERTVQALMTERSSETTIPQYASSHKTTDLQKESSSEDWQGNAENDSTDQVHLGRSSAATFLDGLQRAIQGQAKTKRQPLSLAELGSHCQSLPPMSSDYLLPPRHLANQLFDRYRRDHFPILPALDIVQLQGQLEGLYAGQEECVENKILLSLINLVFAIGARSLSASESQSAEYFARARRLMQFDILQGHSFQVLQALILCAHYLQSVDQPRQGWTIVGLAIRIAQAFGLHRPSTTSRLSSSEKVLVQRIWHCCLQLDRGTSMTLGRHATIPLSSITAVAIPQANEHPFDFFYHSCQLLNILHGILASIYSQDEQLVAFDCPKVLNDTIRLEQHLNRWEEQLPELLRLHTSLTEGQPCTSPGHVLRQRFLQVKMVLYRPCLTAIVAGEHSVRDNIESSVVLHCAVSCVEAAKEMIDLGSLAASADLNSSMAVPWWYNVMFCYTAATSLLAARLDPQLCARIGAQQLQNSLILSIRIFSSYGSGCPSAARCITVLNSLASRAGCDLPLDTQVAPPSDAQSNTATSLPLEIFGPEDWIDFPCITGVPFEIYNTEAFKESSFNGLDLSLQPQSL